MFCFTFFVCVYFLFSFTCTCSRFHSSLMCLWCARNQFLDQDEITPLSRLRARGHPTSMQSPDYVAARRQTWITSSDEGMATPNSPNFPNAPRQQLTDMLAARPGGSGVLPAVKGVPQLPVSTENDESLNKKKRKKTKHEKANRRAREKKPDGKAMGYLRMAFSNHLSSHKIQANERRRRLSNQNLVRAWPTSCARGTTVARNNHKNKKKRL